MPLAPNLLTMSKTTPTEPPHFDAREASKFFFRGGHTGWLGLKFLDQGENWVELELPWREDLLGESDRAVLASGPIVSLMDMASGMSIWQTRRSFAPIATLDLRVDYQRPARERSAVRGRVECYRTTRSAAFVRGIAHDGDIDDPVAHVAGVFMTINFDPRQGKVPSVVEASEAGTGDE
ncbi:PaaI family thioesterase [uncultured Erythrobacter sp.]|uniref:PaaI family thioesterase n=1 Tax=uncultured Erythrobacter sp. TaxID=263913 RepID=UPI002639FAA9|nr:PaaI family thioesterase [uncultured Erythrobacter sp.]